MRLTMASWQLSSVFRLCFKLCRSSDLFSSKQVCFENLASLVLELFLIGLKRQTTVTSNLLMVDLVVSVPRLLMKI